MKILNIRQYRQEDALELLTDEEERSWAKINEAYGPALTYELDGKVVACSGIRTHGMGEIWAVFGEGAKELKFTLGKESKRALKKWMEENDLFLVIATVDKTLTKEQREFLEFLGFTKTETYTFRRDF